jgi:hypothetical protein
MIYFLPMIAKSHRDFPAAAALFLLCIPAVGANFLLNTLSVFVLRLPLFLDTLFTCALAFAACSGGTEEGQSGPRFRGLGGTLPGIAAAILTTMAQRFRDKGPSIFVICSISEVLLIWAFKKKFLPRKASPVPEPFSPISTFAVLLLLYTADFVIISVLGGIIDFISYEILPGLKRHFSPEDTFKMGFLQNSIPTLAMNIISRIPINIVDRLITIFGGFCLSLPIEKLLKRLRKR